MYLKRETFLWFYTIFMTIATLKAEFNLTILHTNDMHARIEEINNKTGKCIEGERCYGGFARVAYEVKKLKDEINNTMFLNAGDNYQGTPMYSLFKWKPFAELLPMLDIDAMSLGNHEFDDGIDGLVPFLEAIDIPVVSCNIDTKEEPSLKTKNTTLEPYYMFTVEGVEIAVIGYITPKTKLVSCTGEVTFSDEVEKIKEYAKEAKEENATLIFAVGHSGFEKDQEIAREVPEVDVVIGGHSDSFLYTGDQPDTDTPVAEYPKMITQETTGKRVPVVQAFGYTKYLGKLDLVWYDNFTLASATGNPILLDSSVSKDEDVEKKISEWTKQLAGVLGQRKGASKVLLDGKECRLSECNVGNLMTDALVHYVVNQTKGNQNWTDAPIAILNSGAIRSSIQPSDNVTWGDILAVLPFDKQLVRLSMNGSTLMKALSLGAEKYHERRKGKPPGTLLQVSGLKVTYEKNSTGHLFFKSALARCKKCKVPKYYRVTENNMYSVAMTLFLSEGGDGYSMFTKEAVRDHVYEEVDLKIMAKYLEQMSPVHTGLEGRIVITKQLPTKPKETTIPEKKN